MTSVLRSVLFVGIVGFLPASVAMAAGVYPLFGLEDGDPSAGLFPSDRFTERDHSQNTGLRVNLPKPDCAVRVSDCEDLDAINTLDGFNLQPRLSIPFSGPIDPGTATSEHIFLVRLGSTVREHHGGHGRDGDDGHHGRDWHGKAYRSRQVEVVGINQVVWDPETNTLHAESDELLDQHTRYALIVTSGVRDESGKPVEPSHAFKRFRHDRNFGQTKDRDLKRYRQALSKALARADAAGVHRRDIVAASVFTTQSITAFLEKIRDQIKAATPEPADFGLGPGGARTVAAVNSIRGITNRRQIRTDLSHPNSFSIGQITPQSRQLIALPGAVAQVAFGKYRSPSYLTPCVAPAPEAPCDRFIPPVGTRTGTPLVQGTEEVFFNLFLPAATPDRPRPAAGWPVVIHNMGSLDTKELGSFLLAPAMAAHGIALIGINGVGQGFGSLSTLTLHLDLDGDTVVDSVATFSAGGRSFDQNGDGVIGTGTIPTSEGNDSLPQAGFIRRRDHFRQSVVDFMQLVRVIEVGIDVDGDGVADLDPSHIYFVGSSHGANHGTAFLALEPRLRGGVLTNTGGAAIDPFRLSPGNRPFVGRYLARRSPSLLNAAGIARLAAVPISTPRFNENLPLRDGIPLAVELEGSDDTIHIQSPVINTVPGAMDIQRVLERTRWSVQANDPLAYAPYLRKRPLDGVPKKSVIVQFARGDQTIPNPAMTAVLRAGELADYATFFRNDLAFAANPNTTLTKNPHEFATRLTPPLTPEQAVIVLQAQRQIGAFFAKDGTEIIDPDEPCVPNVSGCLFEVPIVGPLPEDLGFIP